LQVAHAEVEQVVYGLLDGVLVQFVQVSLELVQIDNVLDLDAAAAPEKAPVDALEVGVIRGNLGYAGTLRDLAEVLAQLVKVNDLGHLAPNRGRGVARLQCALQAEVGDTQIARHAPARIDHRRSVF